MLPFSLKPFRLASLCALGIALLSGAQAVHAQETEYDDKAAVIFTYFSIGNDDMPSASVTLEQFTAQIEELSSGAYTVKALPEIIEAFEAGEKLPDRTIALTFDGADISVLTQALPLLEEHDFPFTVFVPADKVDSGLPYLSWAQLRTLKKSGLASFGLHPAAYNRLADDSEGEIRRQINNSHAAMRKELGLDSVTLFAYPFGEYDAAYAKTVRAMGFKAAFGQQSGVAWSGDDLFALPRFTLTERYGDLERFQMTANALPLPVKDVAPADPHLTSLSPAIGFTVPDALTKSLASISCFSSTDEKPKLEVMNTRVELRLEQPFSELRPRINCTMPASTSNGEEPRWRWYGTLYTVPQSLLKSVEENNEKTPGDFSSDVPDEFTVE